MEIPDDPLVRRAALRARRIRRIFWVGCLWLLGWTGMCLEQAISWSDTFHGLMNGFVMGIVLSPFLLIYLIPLGLIGRAIGSWKPLRPWRWWISLVPPVLMVGFMVVPRILDRVNPARRFERFIGTRFPENVRNLQTFCWGGYFADITDTYTFETTKEETNRLIRDMKLEKATIIPGVFPSGPPGMPRYPVPGWSNPEKWKIYERPSGAYFIELFTDETHTRVHVFSGTI